MVMYDSPCEPQDRLKVLKTISHQFFLSSVAESERFFVPYSHAFCMCFP